jgi:hypothetical protein
MDFVQIMSDRACQGRQIHAFTLERHARNMGKLQQVVNQSTHILRFAAHAVEMAPGVVVQLRAGVFHHRQAPAVHGAQRRTQVMRNRIGEGFEFLVGCFELGSAVAHAPLQLGVQPLQLVLKADVTADFARDGGDLNTFRGSDAFCVLVPPRARPDLPEIFSKFAEIIRSLPRSSAYRWAELLPHNWKPLDAVVKA